MTSIALTGSTGHVGARVANALADLLPKLIVRDPKRAPSIPGTSVAIAEYNDRRASVAALKGIDVLFMVSAAEAKLRWQQHRAFIDSASIAGVRHIVYTSFVGASATAIFTLGRDHADAEDAIRASGMTFTILRDNFYSDLLPLFADGNGDIRGPAGRGRVSAVARADVADVAAAVIRDSSEHLDAVYELTGPEALNFDEIAARAGRALGRDLRYRPETLEEAYASRAVYSAEPWQVDAWVSTYTSIAAGECESVWNDVERITGRPARTLEEAIAEDLQPGGSPNDPGEVDQR